MDIKIYDAEYRFMCIIWDKEPVTSTELVVICSEKFGWKKSTTYSVIKRLSERGAIKNEKAIVTSLVSQLEVQKYESEQVIEKTFDNSLPSFIAAFIQNKKLTQDEVKQIKSMIEDATK